jgi:DNA (cytosine-5)-methyltransferase 1
VNGLIVDLFAGGGGASVGIEAALERPVSIAINHSPTALAVHKANHPYTVHLTADIWEVKPLAATNGRPVDLLWASPDCTHFSQAKGGKPRNQKIRSLAWAVTRWAASVKPKVIFVENVSEFQGWGPLDQDGKPIKARMGETFRRWTKKLEKLGYVVDHRVLDSSHYGAPTKRRRLFLIARCDGEPIRWPKPTHGPGRKHAYRTAAECIDWSLPCPSIFERKKPLADKTLRRIAVGIERFVINNPKPYIVGAGGPGRSGEPAPVDRPLGTVLTRNDRHIVVPHIVQMAHGESSSVRKPESLEEPLTTVTGARRTHALISPTLIQTGYGEREGQAPRVLDLEQPLGTIMAQGSKHALVAAFLAKHFGGVVGTQLTQPTSTITAKDHQSLAAATLIKMRGTGTANDVEKPLDTITSGGNHYAEVRAFLTYYATQDGPTGQDLNDPMRTILTKDRFGLVTIEGADYAIVDIGMRMLQPHELLKAQFGRFADGYDMAAANTKEKKVRLIGTASAPSWPRLSSAATSRGKRWRWQHEQASGEARGVPHCGTAPIQLPRRGRSLL